MKVINIKLLLLCLFFHALVNVTVAEDLNTERKIQAGYLYNFIKFIHWPPENTETFNVCIVGVDPFGALIDSIENRTAFGLPIKLFRFNVIPRPQRCHMVFIDAVNPDNVLKQSTQQFGIGSNTLLVGDGETFATRGGAIGFVVRGARIKLQINLKVLQQSGLSVSAKLLEVAEIVGENHDD